ncbi:unnamed protein product [Phaedon cochleariae]|uniref:Origin recognition complex subunit 2 n=1 Tax=Phaedon cochleariae TaxID=80249 RepID=A0A9N9SMC0_PHACE|nr:unnamed protein product [Phaedon cochleariae]
MASGSAGLRKTSRSKKPSLKAMESLYLQKLEKSGYIEHVSSDEDVHFFTEEDLSSSDVEKPRLLHENDIVHGEDIFKFQTRKTRDGLAQKAAQVCIPKTPHVVRHKTKTRITKLLQEDSCSEYEVSSEESPESSSYSENSTEEEDSSETEKDESPKKSHKGHTEFKDMKMIPTQAKGARSKYTIKTDEYFENFNTNKVKTSNNTLDKLKTPRLPQYELQKLLKNLTLSQKHKNSMKRLSLVNESNFPKWFYLLNENFNILLYGLGSKKDILNKFNAEYLGDVPVVVINGFFPTLSIKNILDAISIDLLEMKETSGNAVEAMELIIAEMEKIPETHLYIMIHNIEGDMLRNSKSQNIIARLASVKNIHIIASIDHINAPLIWDHSKLSKFNFIWWDVTSFSPYCEETSFEKSLMVQQSGALALSSLKNVFQSLTTNSKQIFSKIVKYQLENSKSQYYQGLSFKNLYNSCKESFTVSSDLALRAQLTEFVDHKMVKLKRSVDGTEYLVIPLASELLHKFIDDIS